MKTLEELYTEVMGNEEAKVAFVEAIKANDAAAFMAANDCDATQEQLNEFIGLKMAEDGPMELGMDKLAEIAGGSHITETVYCSAGDSCDCSDTCIEDCC